MMMMKTLLQDTLVLYSARSLAVYQYHATCRDTCRDTCSATKRRPFNITSLSLSSHAREPQERVSALCDA